MENNDIGNQQSERLVIGETPHSPLKEKPGPRKGRFECSTCKIRTDGLPGPHETRTCPICGKIIG